eukprot:CAMPEP_0175072368 /NCGR_PEP_ID=MMETSP0052_2-20121109/19864_1 /TAXON_ID=51329 ORGANISM="Polytomella parva, Strain SAG 63-3" /NCGR_SAMPLE_ID=MMETSP0052_2 /ASSEMBLY_ACC=CAM_ASM_000194 /LENGTH=605 /DNA_ID=CAMNT_0016339851 /DNA_START=124 /DNA_END=1943 /DNA_ORIENTATION=-
MSQAGASDGGNEKDDPQQSISVAFEEDQNWLSAYGKVKDSKGRALYSALVTLTLGVLGSTVLPVPYAFSNCGIMTGVLTMLLVAFANDCTCCMLIRAAAYTGRSSYEQLALWSGGRRAKIFTQISLILLLYGTMCGGLAFLSDVAHIMVEEGLNPASVPSLLRDDGRPVMILVVLTVLLPLCLQRHIREFERAATFGVVVVIALCSVIIHKAVSTGFPAVRDGELPVFKVKWNSHLPEAFAVLGFAFYMQPMLMPLVKEMPPGPEGSAISERAVHITLYLVACGAYGTVGVFGASAFGSSTQSNIMVNRILSGQTPTLILYAALLGYLCCGMVTTHYALRASLDELLVGPDAPFTWVRHVMETLAILSASVAVAVNLPDAGGKNLCVDGVYGSVSDVLRHPGVHPPDGLSPPHLRREEEGGGGRGLREPLLGGRGGLARVEKDEDRLPSPQPSLPLSSSATDTSAGEGSKDSNQKDKSAINGTHATDSDSNGKKGHSLGLAHHRPTVTTSALSPSCSSSSSATTNLPIVMPLSPACPNAPPLPSLVSVSLKDFLICALVLFVGVGFSVAGLWVGAVDLYHYLHPDGVSGTGSLPMETVSQVFRVA